MILILLFAFWDYSYNLDIDFSYDNNIYAYSQMYIDDFLNGVGPYRFPFETHDDMVSAIDFRLLVRNRLFGPHTTTFSLALNTENFLVNTPKNYQRYIFGLRQSFGKSAVKFSYEIIPTYLIRYYMNPQGSSTEYIGCEVAYHTVSGIISFSTIEEIMLSAGYGHKWDNYTAEFNRYDANGHIILFGIEKQLSKNLDFGFEYNFRTSDTDSADVVSSSTDLTPDGSFYQHSLTTDLSLRTKTVVPTTIKLSYDYGYRNYSTSSMEDSLHFGRRDHQHIIKLTTSSRILTGLHLKLLLVRQWRSVTSEILSDINDIKDYTKYKAGVGLEFYF